jgi:DNA-directed RNA polymerase specialized sigma subunit
VKKVVEIVVPEGPDGPNLEDRVTLDDNDMEVVATKRGRPRKSQNDAQLAKVLNLYFIEKMSMRKVADVLGVSHMSVYRMLSDPNIELLI